MDKSNPSRRKFIFIGAGVTAASGLGATLIPLFGHMNPASDALPNIKVDLSEIDAGDDIKILVNKQLIRVKHLTDAELKFVGKDKSRFQIYSALCPKEGCVLLREDRGDLFSETITDLAWYCACCGAFYDLLGQYVKGGVLKRNLEVPKYEYLSDKIIEFKRIPTFAR